MANIQEASYLFIKYCEFDDAMYDYIRYCDAKAKQGVYSCSFTVMGQTLMKKVFQVTTVINEVSPAFQAGIEPPGFYPQIEAFFDKMGEAFGKILRYATEFDPKVINPN